MVEYNDIVEVLYKMQELQENANVFLRKRKELESSLRSVDYHIKSYCCDKFNEEHEDLINSYQCEDAYHNNANIDYHNDSIHVQTDNPRTGHPYDAHSMKFKISDLFEDEKFLDRIANVTVGCDET